MKKMSQIDEHYLKMELEKVMCGKKTIHSYTLQDVFNAFHIFKGDSNIADREDGIHDAQGGLYTPNDGSPPYYVVHIDQDFLDASTVQALAAVLTHEGFHLAGYSHSSTDSYPYTTHPFNLQDKCVGA